MSTLTLKSQEDRFWKGVGYSLTAHTLILLSFFVKSLVFPPVPFDEQSAVRVDLVALPDKMQPDQMPAAVKDAKAPEAKAPEPEKPTAKPEPIKPKPTLAAPAKPVADAINLDKVRSKQKDALSRLKTSEALDQIKQDVKKETEAERQRIEALAAASRAQQGIAKIKGNALAAGSALTGIDKLEHDEYKSAIDHHIKQFWQLPEWLAKKGLRAQAIVRIDATGHLISKQLTRSSGNPDFDEGVLATIDRSSPLPKPPSKFIPIVGSDGIVVEFGE